jgi:hypothetical protein
MELILRVDFASTAHLSLWFHGVMVSTLNSTSRDLPYYLAFERPFSSID